MNTKRKVIAVYIVICMLLSAVPTTVAHASGYDPDAAVNYAAAHWNDGVGVCDQFVKACLAAGGVNISAGGVANVKSALEAYGTSYVLQTSGYYINASDNSGKISAGDPIFFHCSSDGFVHVAICSGVDSSGHVCAYGHNAAWNNQQYLGSYHDGNGHSGSYITVYSVHMSGGGSSSDNTDLDAGAYTAYAVGTNGALAVNDWAAPSPSGSNEISSIPEGAACTVYPKRSIGNWYCVVYNGVCGYAYGTYLTTTNPNPAPAPVTPTTYTVSFDANGGSGAPASQTKTAGSAITLSRTCPTRLDYEFLGWSTSSTATSATWNSGGTYADDASATLYAIWRYRTFTITYNSDGGSITPESQIKHFGQALAISSTVPKKTFTVYFDANGGTVTEAKRSFSTELLLWDGLGYDADGTLATWVQLGIGETLPSNFMEVNVDWIDVKDLKLKAIYKMVAIGTLPTPSKKGYTFEGWYTKAVDGTKISESSKLSAEPNNTLYAHWTKDASSTQNISYDANGGSGAPTILEKKADETVSISSAAPTKSFSLSFNANGGTCASNVKAVACSFRGWNTRADGSGTAYNSGASYSGNDDLTLYAQWNNPTVGSILPAAVRSGYSFDGWYTQAVGGKQIESGSTLSTSMTLYAHWTQQKNSISFTDVDENDFYYQPVLWAAEKGITSGTSATTFSPESYCTRAQVVTFLWRAKGSPAPSSSASKFTDVSDNSGYSAQAIIWATENGIASGVSATRFAPNESITRGQFVTFLWRSASQPDVSGTNPFSDLSASSYYYKSVMWAYEHGITTGTSSTTFSPDSTCTRGQVVTFLYRNLGE